MTKTQVLATRPLCVGRFLIDVPMDATVTGTQTTSSGVSGTISVQTGTSKSAFDSKMLGIETRLRSALHETEGSRLSEVLRPDANTYIFRYRKSEIGTRVYQIDGYRWADSTMFAIESGSSNDDFQLVVDEVIKGSVNVRLRETWTIPTDTGFCFDGGFLPGGDVGFEATGVQLTFKSYPGLVMFMETRVRSKSPADEAGLIERTDAALKLMDTQDKPTVLRRSNDRRLAFGTAEDVLWKHRKGDHYALKGDVEMVGLNGATDKPDVAFGIVLDPPKDGTEQPEEGAVLRLWDSVVESLRLRPGAI